MSTGNAIGQSAGVLRGQNELAHAVYPTSSDGLPMLSGASDERAR